LKLNTFSIIAYCPSSGHLGCAVATRFPAVGAWIPHVKAKVGIVVSQGWVNPLLGVAGLEMLEAGVTANLALEKVLLRDPGRELRQVALIDRFGNPAVYTGSENDDYKGHITGEHFSVQGNLLTGPEVLEEMIMAYTGAEGPLEAKLLKALEAGTKAGGDLRGKQSAALRVEAIEGFPYVNIRVDDHPEPVFELARIYEKNVVTLALHYRQWVECIKSGVRFDPV
jgi:uncharacterized Ntn-hydrolase superfamily protein